MMLKVVAQKILKPMIAVMEKIS